VIDLQQRPGQPALLCVDAEDAAPLWAAEQRAALRAAVTEHGALLVRGLGLAGTGEVEALSHSLGEPMAEREAFAARTRYGETLYSASKWPPSQPMCLHHGLSYALRFPSLLLFACLAAPSEGGATLLADSTLLLDMLPSGLVARFEREGWLLVRHYNGEVGPTLAQAFGSDEHEAVEAYCRANAIGFEWRSDGLRTRQRRSAIVRHPRTGRRCWFNQIAFLNEWSLDAEVRDFLVDSYGADALPFNTRFGNGEPIGPEVVRAINGAYEAVTLRDDWQAGDLLLVDNLRTAHGRERYTGPRELLTALLDAQDLSRCMPTIDIGVDEE
jgi:alpha-ketoglutarate-dependent taurine dioxygenase